MVPSIAASRLDQAGKRLVLQNEVVFISRQSSDRNSYRLLLYGKAEILFPQVEANRLSRQIRPELRWMIVPIRSPPGESPKRGLRKPALVGRAR